MTARLPDTPVIVVQPFAGEESASVAVTGGDRRRGRDVLGPRVADGPGADVVAPEPYARSTAGERPCPRNRRRIRAGEAHATDGPGHVRSVLLARRAVEAVLGDLVVVV